MPVFPPAVVGEYFVCNVADWPAGIVTGAVTPPTLNPFPATPICDTCRSDEPEFFSVTFCVLLPFTKTLPKFNAVALSASEVATLPDCTLSFACDEWPPCEVIAESVPDVVVALLVL